MRTETAPGRRSHYLSCTICCALVTAALAPGAAVRAGPGEEAPRIAQSEEPAREHPFTDMPVSHAQATLGPAFGPRKDPFTRRDAFHSGVDIIAPSGAEVTAAGAGVVAHAARRGAYGLLVEINHGHGWKTRYGHLASIDVKRGEPVISGQRIGTLGSTGRTTFPHVHVEVRKDKKTIDPATVLSLPERKYETEEDAAESEEAANATPLTVMPVDPYRISSTFGARRDPYTNRAAFHSGVDFGSAFDAEVRAAGAGVVSYAGRRGAYDLLVEIDHGEGWRTRYAHLRRIDVKPGQSVTAGQRIGSMGSSSHSTAPHLHFEVWKDKKPIDPLKVLPLPEDKQRGDTG